jgi:hypothetical protein
MCVGTTPGLALAQQTYPETVGVNTNTWTNYTNAGGTQGPTIPRYSTVQIACRLVGFRVANGNTWWYRIAQSPWDNRFYASADAFYNNGQTSGTLKGTPWVDESVPVCGQEPAPPPPPPPPSPTVELAQGPAAPKGFRYAITLRNFPANSGISVACYDSKSPGGFYSFTMQTDGSGSAFTQSQCYSADGPDHWVVASGRESNRVSWGSAGGGGNPPPGGNTSGGQQPPAQPALSGPFSVFYSPNNDWAAGQSGLTVGDANLKFSEWTAGSCQSKKADDFAGPNVHTLAGWSLGRLGPVYFLHAASADRVAKIRTIILFDPGDMNDFEGSVWDRLRGKQPCDVKFDINGLLANWLKSNDANKLIIISGKETKKDDYAGIWKHYIAGIWNKPFASRAMICNYDGLDHQAALRKYAHIVKSPPPGCPDGIASWHP